MAVDTRRVRELFGAVIEIPEAADRQAYLDRECGNNAELRQRLNALLQAHESPASAVMQPLASEGTVAYAPSEKPGTLVAGRYKLLESIGEGGMGTVWVAEQTEPVRRKVALKLIKAGMDSRSVLARFEAERQALALMDHPNIAKVLDGGLTDQGRPYFVMEYVKGVPITEYCDATRLNVHERLNLFIQVCQAVQHAHQKGIIHRDLKPSNILVAPYDDKPVPKIIDFGLAKAMHQSLTERTLHTAHESVLGTPLYMSPEQAQLNNLDVDTRSDIYSLGVLLYELLTGTTPLEKQRFKQAAWDEVRRIIREEEPPRPSTRLSSTNTLPSLAAGRHTDPLKLTKMVKGELDWIVMKALEKDRTRRYETANGFARDIQRYMSDEVVEARPASTGYRLRKFVARNQGKVLAAGLVLGMMIAGIAGTTFGLIQAEHGRREAVLARAEEAEQRSMAEKARDRTRQALDSMTSSVTGYSLATQTAVNAEQKKFLTEVLTYYREFAGDKSNDQEARARSAAAAFRVGYIENRLGQREQALAAFQSARDGYARLVSDFPSNTEYRYELARSLNNMGLQIGRLGKRSEAEEHHRQALAISEKLVSEAPVVPKYRNELAGYHSNLANLMDTRLRSAEAEEHYRKALALQEKLVSDFPLEPDYRRHLGHHHGNLGILLLSQRRLPEASDLLSKSLVIRQKLHSDFPAVPEYRQDLAGSHSVMARLKEQTQKYPEALEESQKALNIMEKLTAEFPADPGYQQELAVSLVQLGMLSAQRGKPEESVNQVRRALTIQEKLTVDFPSVPMYRVALAGTYDGLASLMTDMRKKPEAYAELYKALVIMEKLAGEFPDNVAYRRSLASRLSQLGFLAKNLKKYPQAEEHHRKSVSGWEKLAVEFPAMLEYQINVGGGNCNLGMTIRDSSRPAESLVYFDQAIHILQTVYDKAPDNVTARRFLRNSHSNRAIAYDRLQKYAEAVKDYDRAIKLSQPGQQQLLRGSRAYSQVQAGRVAEAVVEVAELSKSEKWTATEWYDFSCVYSVASGKIKDKKQEYSDRAMQLLQKAVNVGYKDFAHIMQDADLDPLREREDFKKLLAELEKQPILPTGDKK